MKALTLTQPWATLVAKGRKKIETRSWNTNYRGLLAIHAAKGFPSWAQQECYTNFFLPALFDDYDGRWQSLPTGAIVATCELIATQKIDEMDLIKGRRGWSKGSFIWYASEQEKAFGDYSIGRYMWFLENIKMLREPIPARGALGLWEWEGV